MDDDLTPDADESAGIRNLRAAAEEGRKAKDELARLQRENLFLRANIPTDKGPGALLFKASEATTLDQLLAEAEAYGITPGNSGLVVPASADDGRQLLRDAVAGAAPAGAVDTPTPDPRDEALSRFHEDLARGLRREDAQLAAIDRLLVAGASGDQRVLYDPDRWREEQVNGR